MEINKQFKNQRLIFFLTILVFCIQGCSLFTTRPLKGLIYTHTFTPYTLDLNNTKFSKDKFNGKIIRIKEPFSGYGGYAEFSSNAIGDIAKKNGLTHVYFADLETFNILGIFRSKTIHIHGRTDNLPETLFFEPLRHKEHREKITKNATK